jgi:hypothetical protein
MASLQITLDDNQLKELTRIRAASTTNYADCYRYIYSVIKDTKVSDDTKYWFSKASEINSNDPNSSANTFIRSVTRNGLLLDGNRRCSYRRWHSQV